MSRPFAWLDSARDLHRSVSNGQRSVYSRRDLQQLFKLQPRAAQKLIELMPRAQMGSSLFVAKQDLAELLERVIAAPDVAKLFEEIRRDPPPVIRRKARRLQVRFDGPRQEIGGIPEAVTLQRGRLEVRFDRPEDLAQAMVFIAEIIESPAFEREYCVAPREPDYGIVRGARILHEGQAILEELAQSEAANVEIETSST